MDTILTVSLLLCGLSSCDAVMSRVPLYDELQSPLFVQLNMTHVNKQLQEYLDPNLNKITEIEASISDFEGKINAEINTLQETINGHITSILARLGALERNQKLPDACDMINVGGGNGVYRIYTNNYPNGFDVYCDMETDNFNGGWTVIQRRIDGTTDFYRGWDDYRRGFGDVQKEYWLGLEKIHEVTFNGAYELRVDVEDFTNKRAHATYTKFNVGSEANKFNLTVGGYSGDGGDSLSYQNSFPFSTRDRDNDKGSHEHCAEKYHGAWWYHHCHHSNLNGLYMDGGKISAKGITWYRWKSSHYSMKTASMMIRKRK